MIYLLTLPKQAGGLTVVNDRRAALIALPEGTTAENALGVARGIAAAADPGNAFSWRAATGGPVTEASLGDLPDALAWLDTNEDTPSVLVDGAEEDPDA